MLNTVNQCKKSKFDTILAEEVAGPAEQGGQWTHVSTVIWKFSAISKTVRQRSVVQTVQKLQTAIVYFLRALLNPFKIFDWCYHLFENYDHFELA